jgi:hypothetical protein
LWECRLTIDNYQVSIVRWLGIDQLAEMAI